MVGPAGVTHVSYHSTHIEVLGDFDHQGPEIWVVMMSAR